MNCKYVEDCHPLFTGSKKMLPEQVTLKPLENKAREKESDSLRAWNLHVV